LNINTFCDYLWFFIIYSLIGWFVEVIFAAIKYRELVNRGFLNGPYCPIYGAGVLVVIICLSALKDNILPLFIAASLLTTLLEAVVGVALHKIFNKKWWDYTHEPFNFKGYVCLRASLIWGFGCVIVLKFIHPYIFKFVNIIPSVYANIFIIIIAALIILDFTATVATVNNLDKHLSLINELAVSIKEISDELAITIAGNTIELLETGEEIKEVIEDKKNQILTSAKKRKEIFTELNKKYESLIAQKGKYTRLIKAFPNLKTGKYAESLQKIKEHAKIKNKADKK